MLALAVYVNIGVWEMLALAGLLLLLAFLRSKAGQGAGVDVVPGSGIPQDPEVEFLPETRLGFRAPDARK